MSAASVLDVQQNTDKKGKKYYKFELLSRTGQCHPMLTATPQSLLMRCNALQLLCQQSACRNVFGNFLQGPSSKDLAACIMSTAGGRALGQPFCVCGPCVEASLERLAYSAASSAADGMHHPAGEGVLL